MLKHVLKSCLNCPHYLIGVPVGLPPGSPGVCVVISIHVVVSAYFFKVHVSGWISVVGWNNQPLGPVGPLETLVKISDGIISAVLMGSSSMNLEPRWGDILGGIPFKCRFTNIYIYIICKLQAGLKLLQPVASSFLFFTEKHFCYLILSRRVLHSVSDFCN